MKHTVSNVGITRQEQPVTPDAHLHDDEQGNCDTPTPLVRLYRSAIDATDWKHEALAKVLRLPSPRYLSGILSGEKRLNDFHITNTPREIKVLMVKRAARELGMICVEPLEPGQAAEAFTAGLLSLLPRCVPAKAELEARPMLKVG